MLIVISQSPIVRQLESLQIDRKLCPLDSTITVVPENLKFPRLSRMDVTISQGPIDLCSMKFLSLLAPHLG
jgi:hypothetical protein